MVNRANEMAQFIKSKRKELSLSQTELSTKIGFSKNHGQFVSNVERGRCQFPVNAIKTLSKVLEVSEETIIEIMCRDYKNCIQESLNESKTIN